jgi:hypothetical protein
MSGWGSPPQGYGPPPPPPPFQPPPNPMNPFGPMGMPPAQPPNHSLATGALVCGILAVFPGCCCGLFGLPLSVTALVLGIISLNQINTSGGQLGGKNLAIAAIVCGACALVLHLGGAAFNVTNHTMRTLHI